MRINNLIQLFFVLFFAASCNSSKENTSMQPVDVHWAHNKKLEIPFVVKEQNLKNIIFVIRNNNTYPYSNLRLFVELTDEKNKTVEKDTLNFILAKPNGEWIGNGFGDTKELRFQYKTDYQFPKIGKYKASISHAMRKDSLSGIEDIGVVIETK